MLKKITLVQFVVLIAVSALGLVLVNDNTEGVKLLHAGLGLLAGGAALVATYFAFTQKKANSIRATTGASIVFTFLAGIGGKLAESDYTNGLLLMRSSAFVALAVTFVTLALLHKENKK